MKLLHKKPRPTVIFLLFHFILLQMDEQLSTTVYPRFDAAECVHLQQLWRISIDGCWPLMTLDMTCYQGSR